MSYVKRRWLGACAVLAALAASGLAVRTPTAAPPVQTGADQGRPRDVSVAVNAASGVMSSQAQTVGPAEAGQSMSRVAAPSKPVITLADWSRYPSGLLVAAEQVIGRRDGAEAYALVGILEDCARLPKKLEETRQQLAELNARRTLTPGDRQWTNRLMNLMQQDQAHCQVLTGDLKALRRQLLEVAVRAGVEGSGVDLWSDGNEEPWVGRQVLREAEAGDAAALRKLALGDISQATRLQRDAARDALVRGARDSSLNEELFDNVQSHLNLVERHVAVEEWRADVHNAAKAAAADAAYTGRGAPKLQPSTDMQVRALADQYLEALKKRRAASRQS